MVCAQCGGVLEAESRFCPRCGAPVVMRATPPAGAAMGHGAVGGQTGSVPGGPDPRYGQGFAAGYGRPALGRLRVERNLRSLGVLWCCFGVYRIAAGLMGLLVFRSVMRGDGFGQGFPFGPGFHIPHAPWMTELVPVMVTGLVMSAALAIFTGLSLLRRAPWARVLAIIAGVLALIKFPLGTALGIYTLYVLAPRASGTEWEEITGNV